MEKLNEFMEKVKADEVLKAEITAEEVERTFNPAEGELADDELGSVAGGDLESDIRELGVLIERNMVCDNYHPLGEIWEQRGNRKCDICQFCTILGNESFCIHFDKRSYRQSGEVSPVLR